MREAIFAKKDKITRQFYYEFKKSLMQKIFRIYLYFKLQPIQRYK